MTIVEIKGSEPCTFEQVPLTPLRNMRSIEGELETILQNGLADPHREDYLLVKLTDTHAILDVMGKLREVFPNILHLERPGLMAQRSDQAVAPQQLNTNELSMFEDFFGQVMQRELTKDEKALVEQVIDNVQQGDVK